jgi:hypothetical protein
MTGMGEMMGVDGMDGPMETHATIVISEEYGMKMENHMTVPGSEGKTQKMTQLAYLLPEEKAMISIVPEQKMYQRIEFTDDLLERTKKQNNDPREMIKQMMNCEYTELEPTEIDGIQVQGFQTTDPAYTMGVASEVQATLWVDAETWMPVKSEIWSKISGMEMTCVIEEAAIKGLRTYAKFFGQYPEKIDMASLVPSLMKKVKELMDDPKTEYAKEFSEKMKADEADGDKIVMQQAQNEFMPISGLAMFHMKLLQDKKDPAYYGDQVTPEDTDKVLMRWKGDDGKYKVIFGDLSSVEMEYEDLIKIEPQPEPAQP